MELAEAGQPPNDVVRDTDTPHAADVAVAIVSHNNAETIASVVREAEHGLARSFPPGSAVLLVADLGSTDDSVELTRLGVSDPRRLVAVGAVTDVARAAGMPPSRAAGLRAIFESAAQLGVKALAVIDPDRTTLDPDAVDRLLSPVLHGDADFVAPIYDRPRFAGAINTSLVYPFTRALYGSRLRYPAAVDFGCSMKFGQYCGAQSPWGSDEGRIATDFWLVHRALTGGFRLGQAVIGPRPNAGADARLDLSSVLATVLGTLFTETDRHVQVWQRVRTSEPVPFVGIPRAGDLDGPAIDLTKAIEAFRLGLQHLMPVWKVILPPTTLLDLTRLSRQSERDFRLPDSLWARIVYDFAIAFHTHVMSKEHLLSAFTPLYLGWLASHIAEMTDADFAASERRVEELCLRFESEKPYLISRWRWPDRFDS